MSQGLKESTHTGDAFVDFIYDLLEYAIPEFGFTWIVPEGYRRLTQKIFKESFGDAIILFRNRHEKEFDERFRRYLETESIDDVTAYLRVFCNRTFKGDVPLMEFIVYCAFTLDVCLFYIELEEFEVVYRVADEVFGVFYNYVETYFTIIGGWHALYRVAEQYVDFVRLTSANNLTESASEGLEVSKL